MLSVKENAFLSYQLRRNFFCREAEKRKPTVVCMQNYSVLHRKDDNLKIVVILIGVSQNFKTSLQTIQTQIKT